MAAFYFYYLWLFVKSTFYPRFIYTHLFALFFLYFSGGFFSRRLLLLILPVCCVLSLSDVWSVWKFAPAPNIKRKRSFL
jgi:hypothetical protein